MKNYFTLFAMLFFTTSTHAQMKVALHHNGNATMFSGATPFISAYNAAVNGDTIYLPGGIFSPPASVSKSITIIGAGHYPDSTTATSVTNIGSLYIALGADKLKIQGLMMAGGLTFEYNSRIDSVVVYRCYISGGGINYQGVYDTSHNCRGHLIYQNVINSISLVHTSNIKVFNNIISSMGSMQENAWIRNNKIDNIAGMSYCLFENNIISNWSAAGYNTYRNNIFEGAPSGGTNTYINNYDNHPFSTIFQTYTIGWFGYSENYHLISPGSYPGTDGSQAGIYGGLYPYKEGAVPSNPHIRSKSIGLTPDINGKLQVNITVAAQDN